MSTSPLAGTRVLDLTRLLPGNYCTWLLAALGAEVIKVEDPGAGDYMRTIGVQVDGQSSTHHLVNRNKRSIVIDLKSDAGREVLLELVETSDVLVESFRPGVLARLGVGVDVLRARRPSLVVASISGYGAEGPLSQEAAHDLNALAFSGFLERLVGPKDGLPVSLTMPLADLIGGSLFPALGVLGLLLRARQTGEGGWLDASLADGVALLPSVEVADVLAGQPLSPRGTEEFDGRPFYRTYRLRDGMVAVGAVEERFWRELCDALGEPDLIDAQWDDDRRVEVTDRLVTRFGALTREEVLDLLAGRDTCTNLVNEVTDMVSSEQARARDLVRPSPDVPMQVLAPPFRIDGGRPAEGRGAPRQGSHSVEVLRELGLAEARITALLAEGAVVDAGDLDVRR